MPKSKSITNFFAKDEGAAKKRKLDKPPSSSLPLIGATWKKALHAEFDKDYYKKLIKFVEDQRKNATVFPKPEDVYSWSNYCTIDEVKVVILGQDPYHDVGQAHGLCFSVQKGIVKPPSLVNIYKELKKEYSNFEVPSHGNLSGWAKQGVLLLNAVLTVQAHKANSHKDKGWEKFTDAIIKVLNEDYKHIVFILWGKSAEKKAKSIDQSKHCVLKSAHPSPLSAFNGFFGCDHFKKANEYLVSKKRKAIDWKSV